MPEQTQETSENKYGWPEEWLPQDECVTLTCGEAIYLGGLLRSFCSDPIYDMEDPAEISKRFREILKRELESDRKSF